MDVRLIAGAAVLQDAEGADRRACQGPGHGGEPV